VTWTYGNDPGTSTAAQRRDAVRLTIGDTVDEAAYRQFTDEEIAYWLGLASNDVFGASLFAVEALIAKWARKPAVAHGPSSVNPGGAIDSLRALRDLIARQVAMAAPWFAGGLTISGKQDLANDTDAIQPSFARGMDSHPGTITDAVQGLDEELGA
jgi:hypothetical protein